MLGTRKTGEGTSGGALGDKAIPKLLMLSGILSIAVGVAVTSWGVGLAGVVLIFGAILVRGSLRDEEVA